MASRSLKYLGAAAAFAAAFAVPGAVSAKDSGAEWQANSDDFLLLQLQVRSYKLTNDVRGYQTTNGVCLDLADVIQSLDLPIRLDKKSRRATGWLFAEDQTFTLDRDSNTVQNVNTGRAPLGNEIYDTPEGWCVDSDALSRWFGIRLTPDLYNAVVRLESDEPLPFIEAIERKSRAARLRPRKQNFDLSQYPQADTEYRLWRTPSVDAVVRVGYQGGRGRTSEARARYELYASGEVAGASVEARLSSDDSLKPNSLRVRAYRIDPEGGLLGPLGAREVAVGDVETVPGRLTGQSAVGRGAFVSNLPVQRQSSFSATTLRGTMPAGWDAELYRNGQLIAFQSETGDGRYEFIDIDLYYGRNEFEVVLYGPQGQIRREKYDYPVGREVVEPGKTYYWAGILQDDRDLIDLRRADTRRGSGAWRWGVGVEHGLDQRTSVALGAQSLVLSDRRRDYLETTLWRSIGPMQLELSGAYQLGGGVAARANALGRLGSFNLGARATWVQGDFVSEFVRQDLAYQVGFTLDTSLKIGKLGLPIQGSFDQSRLRDGTNLTEWLIATSVGTRGIALTAQLEHKAETNEGTFTNRADTRLRLLANSRLFGLRVRGSASFDLSGADKGLQTVRLSAEKSIGERSDLVGEVEYDATSSDTRFSAGYSRRFDRFALRADANYSSSGAFGANLALSFSFGPDPARGGIRFSSEKLARGGQAMVTVFRDDDGDGRRSPGEEVLKDVYVEAGLRTTDAITDEKGRAIVDGLKPYVPILVGIDEASLGDPYLTPSTKGVVVVPRPGVATKIELAIGASGEVEGVIHSVSGIELGGVTLELIDARGAVAATTISEFDGFFLFERVPYGSYRLRVASEAARTLEVQQALGSAIAIGRDADIARLGVVKLQPGSTIVARGLSAAPGDTPPE